MKRRDFITKSTIGAATVGGIVTTLGITETQAEQKNMGNQSNADNNAALQESNNPLLESMSNGDKARSGVMIGGIGAGGAEIRKDGIFYNWSIFNNLPKGSGEFLNKANGLDSRSRWGSQFYPYQEDYVLFFILRYKVEGEQTKLKLLQIEDGYMAAAVPMHIYEFPWLSGIDKIEYSARFPYATLKYSDPEMPFEVELKTWAPFVPGDVKNSSLPLMFFDFKIKSTSNKKVEACLIASHRNFAGYDITDKVWTNELVSTADYKYSVSGITETNDKHASYGQMGFASLSKDACYYLGWENRHPYYEKLLEFNTLRNIDDTEGRNVTTKTGKKKAMNRCWNSMGVSKTFNPNEELSHSFILGWNFPNMYDEDKKDIVGHYYSNFFNSGKDVMEYAIKNRADLLAKTNKFIDSMYDSSAPQFVLDQVNSQLNTMVTSGLLGKKMEFGVIEGLTWHQSWGPVGTTDVNMYGGVMVSSLFPELAKSTMKIHKLLQHPGGEIRHSFKKGFATFLSGETQTAVAEGVSERLDLHSQYSVMVLRDFFLTNDKAYLQEMWPSVKKALEYTLTQRDKNGDQQPDMTGIMSSYDNFPMYGMAAYIQSQWLAALASALEAAKVLNDAAFIKKFAPIFEKGKKLAEEKLWNGKYYRLYNSDLSKMKTKDGAGKEIEKDLSGVDEGCLTDQIIGQWAAHWSGLGDIFEKSHRKEALKNILAMSYTPSYGLRNCAWPEDKGGLHPVPDDIWVDQANTCWSGVELSFASFLMYEGLYKEALDVIKTVDTRYRKTGRYWDHQEFGGHYFRPMGAWGILNGMLGLSINQQVYGFNPQVDSKTYKLFFAFPGGYGNVESKGGKLKVNILSGVWEVKGLKIGKSALNADKAKVTLAGSVIGTLSTVGDKLETTFKTAYQVREGQSVEIG